MSLNDSSKLALSGVSFGCDTVGHKRGMECILSLTTWI